jgi:high-affinity K+ transport system ATPase subunit B
MPNNKVYIVYFGKTLSVTTTWKKNTLGSSVDIFVTDLTVQIYIMIFVLTTSFSENSQEIKCRHYKK